MSILPEVASFVIKTVLQKCCGRNHKPNFHSPEESERGLNIKTEIQMAQHCLQQGHPERVQKRDIDIDTHLLNSHN